MSIISKLWLRANFGPSNDANPLTFALLWLCVFNKYARCHQSLIVGLRKFARLLSVLWWMVWSAAVWSSASPDVCCQSRGAQHVLFCSPQLQIFFSGSLFSLQLQVSRIYDGPEKSYGWIHIMQVFFLSLLNNNDCGGRVTVMWCDAKQFS